MFPPDMTLHYCGLWYSRECMSTSFPLCSATRVETGRECVQWRVTRRQRSTAGVTVYSCKPPDRPICTAIER